MSDLHAQPWPPAHELASSVRDFDERFYPMLASKVIAELHEYGHERAVAEWNTLCRELRRLVDLADATYPRPVEDSSLLNWRAHLLIRPETEEKREP